jgi:hypothetical protein
MSFDKNYPNRKDHRKQYRSGSLEDISKSYRPHGGDYESEGNRLVRAKKNDLIAKQELASIDLEKEPYMEGIGVA